MANQAKQETEKELSRTDSTQQHQQVKRLMQYAFMASRGNLNRIKIIELLKNQPLNMHQLSVRMQINYKAVQHHINFLEKNDFVSKIGTKYGAVFFPSTLLIENMMIFDDISKEILGK